jgi:FdrA protein
LSAEYVQARAGAYADSVTLMAVSAKTQAVAGVRAAMIAMATDLNVGLLADLGLAAPAGVGENDLLIAIKADDAESLRAALTVVDEALAARGGGRAVLAGAGGAGGEPGAGGAVGAGEPSWPGGLAARTMYSAARRAGPGLALISVPGQHAFAEALDALEADCDVMIFSDNVPVEREILLKDIAAERGLLVMGPDCGTAIVGGVGLGFSHSVPPGPVGLVAASGTGAQQMICLLDAAGTGVSAVLGVGGRDLSAEVGGRSARAALAVLDADPATELIVVVSKPPDEKVAAELRAHAATLATPVLFALIGTGQADLTSATEAALRTIGHPVPDWPRWDPQASGQAAPPAQDRPAAGPAAGHETVAPDQTGQAVRPAPGHKALALDQTGQAVTTTPHDKAERAAAGGLRGLFAGGTLCDEAMAIAAARLGPVYSNVPLRPDWRIDPLQPTLRERAESGPSASEPSASEPKGRGAALDGGGLGRGGPAPSRHPGGEREYLHVMIDFGADELTAGRPHPMIDQRLRLDRLAAEAADPATAVIMLDVVLGHGAHPDPAAELAPAIARAVARSAGTGGHSAFQRALPPRARSSGNTPDPSDPDPDGPGTRRPGTPRELTVVVSLIGARSDPQGLQAQASTLAQAGAHVFASNAQAARFACDLIDRQRQYRPR